MTASPSVAFTPLKIGDITLSNRLALAPLTRMRADSEHVHHDVAAEYYAQRGSYPGTLLITEATLIAKRAGGLSNVPGIFTPEQIAGWKKVVDAVHAKGSFVYLQLWALGRAAQADQLKSEDTSFEVVSSSDVAFEGGATPRALSEGEIEEYVADYAAAAKAFVEEAGGDGVEIHAANGYLIDQFTQTNSNKRTDNYGGSIENRVRFGLEVTAAVVSAIGEKKTGIRLSPFSDFQGMRMPDAELEPTFTYFVEQLKTLYPEFAYVHLVEPRVSAGNERTPGEGEDIKFIADIWAPAPLLIAGGLKEEDAEPTVAKYKNSVAVYGRYFISNPDLVARVKHNVPFVPYNRDTFYLPGPENTKGYTDYPIEYGPDGKL